MSKLNPQKTNSAQQRLDAMKKEFLNLKNLMVEQENRFLSKINDLEDLVKDQTEILKEISKIRVIFTGPGQTKVT